jgi:beta-glucosidase
MFTFARRRGVVPALAVSLFALLAASGASAASAQARGGAPHVTAGGSQRESAARHAGAGSGGQPWRNRHQPPGVRASELLAALSTGQKIQLALGHFAALRRFGVPPLRANDGPDGVRSAGTTAMPSGQALAATFDRVLAFAYGQVVGSEARGKRFNEWLGPAVDIARTPLAGRQPEAEGEDPFLAGNTSARVAGGARSKHLIATVKHYTAYNQEWGRLGFQIAPNPGIRGSATSVAVSERALQEIYEAPFRTAVQQGHVDSVMCSFNQINGVPSCENPATLGDLKQDGGLTGFVVPDAFFAVRDPVAAALAGVDLPALPGFPSGLTAADFTSGRIPASRLDDIDRRILFAIFDSGVFDYPLPAAPSAQVSTPRHRQVATRVAEAGMVLLKNAHHLLPLSQKVRSIAVIGPSGTGAVFVTGGSAGVPLAPGQAVTPRAGITARAASAGVHVTAVQGSAGDVASPALVPSSALTPSSGTGPGLLGSYWSNGHFSGAPVLTRVDPTVDLPDPPAQAGALWSAKWTGTLTPDQSGLYRFSLAESGIATLKIAGHTFGPAYREATQFLLGPHYVLQGTVRLTAGMPVPVEIDYSSTSGLFSQEIHFGWQPPSRSGIPAAVAAARHADVAIVFANDGQGEGMDRTSLSLPGDQDQLIAAVAGANRRTVVVLNTGGPVRMPWLHAVAGVLEAWYPGQQFGTAIAAVLFGDASPAGRLPVTFPASNTQGPAPATQPRHYPGVHGAVHYDEGLDVGYRWYDATGQRPLFPFGYGLSYQRFAISRVHASYDPVSGEATVAATVKNTSPRPGPATLELYLASPPAAHEPPKQLKGYTTVHLAPGQTRLIRFRLHPADLAYYDQNSNQFTVAPGRYTVLVGTSSADLHHTARFQVTHPGRPR